jgi:hypothetical protein
MTHQDGTPPADDPQESSDISHSAPLAFDFEGMEQEGHEAAWLLAEQPNDAIDAEKVDAVPDTGQETDIDQQAELGEERTSGEEDQRSAVNRPYPGTVPDRLDTIGLASSATHHHPILDSDSGESSDVVADNSQERKRDALAQTAEEHVEDNPQAADPRRA